jgi:2-hydroxy-6-oxonona-2,4-dienedioate hydrolase
MNSQQSAAAQFREAQERVLAENGLDATSTFIELREPRAQVHLLTAGAGDPVLFVSGNAPAVLWAPLAARLAPHYQLLMPDRPGTGLSTMFDFRGVDLREHGVTVLGAMLDAMGRDRVAIVGNSMGGYFAMAFALAHPERVSRLVLLGEPANTAGMPGSRLRYHRLVGTRGLNALLFATVLRPPNDAAAARANLARGRLLSDPGRASDALLECFAAGARMPGASRSFRTMVERISVPAGMGIFASGSLGTHALKPELDRLATPTLFLWGDRDPLGTPDDGRRLVDLMPHARLQVIQDAGHLPWLEWPGVCADALRAFLADEEPNERPALDHQPRAQAAAALVQPAGAGGNR